MRDGRHKGMAGGLLRQRTGDGLARGSAFRTGRCPCAGALVTRPGDAEEAAEDASMARGPPRSGLWRGRHRPTEQSISGNAPHAAGTCRLAAGATASPGRWRTSSATASAVRGVTTLVPDSAGRRRCEAGAALVGDGVDPHGDGQARGAERIVASGGARSARGRTAQQVRVA